MLIFLCVAKEICGNVPGWRGWLSDVLRLEVRSTQRGVHDAFIVSIQQCPDRVGMGPIREGRGAGIVRLASIRVGFSSNHKRGRRRGAEVESGPVPSPLPRFRHAPGIHRSVFAEFGLGKWHVVEGSVFRGMETWLINWPD